MRPPQIGGVYTIFTQYGEPFSRKSSAVLTNDDIIAWHLTCLFVFVIIVWVCDFVAVIVIRGQCNCYCFFVTRRVVARADETNCCAWLILLDFKSRKV